ncbi:SDR family oxidoreductase [Pseudooceanicola sp. CBS1P-1]|uniref:Glucose 1-dehydrogenase n=1 Tax=Pseudooceanicola albus TaxID=2692189 RepID=A0A6L7G8U9_9RHOB|nr:MULTISPECIES: SDR family NAD(P)-dependent oxidoreductase [Pseudooceanicola]MBT9384314.1 SDR family oxidoreductase [Pseudooceanicola endophyticus]MXN19948.1 glucose 1-dehydrogenase [Pseudooceanicola albus]
MKDFEDKVALVTGGASGIGAATAKLLARRGARVVLADMNAEKLSVVKAEIEAEGGMATIAVCNVTRDEDIAAAVTTAVETYGKLDYGVNNAGITGPIGPLVDYDLEAARSIVNIDLMAVISCMKEELKVMVPAGCGAIVNTSSIWGLTAGANFVAYTAAKHGVSGATKAAALEVAEQGIRINAIAPGFTYTPMISDQGLSIQKDSEAYKAGAANHPMNRWGEPEDMAQGIAWLLSDAASFTTGTILSIDGGFVAR